MTKTPESPASVGQQLKTRREVLDLTQEALARLIGIATPTVSVTESGRTQISRGKRAAWEKALRLKAGTISRAYNEGADIEPADSSPAGGPYADMSDHYERTIWEMDRVPEEVRRTMIDILRYGQSEESRPTG